MTDFKPRPVRYKELESIGDGFTFANHRRVDPRTVIDALNGTPHALEKVPLNRPKSWWGAQVRLYGLKGKDWSVGACKEVLHEAIARGPLRVPPALIDAEERMNKEYHTGREQDFESHKKAIEEEKRKIIETDQKFRAATTDEERARIDMRRFLQEKFGSEDITFFVLRGLQHHERNQIDAMLDELGLFCVPIVDWPLPPVQTVVVATTNAIAVRERDRIVQEMKEEKAAQDQEKWNTLNKKRLELEGNGESPAGQWALHMPELYNYNRWEHSDGECNIYLPKYNPTDEYAYAKFKFVEFKGYFKIHLVKDTDLSQGVELKVDWEGWAVGGDIYDEYDLETRHVAAITFTSASECRGYIDGWFGGPWEFKGVKVSHETDATAEKCKMKFEREKKHWDEN